jgi:hypothetical protein
MSVSTNFPSLAKALAISLGLLFIQPIGSSAGIISFVDVNDVASVSTSLADITAAGAAFTSVCGPHTCTVTITQPTPVFQSGGPYVSWNIFGGPPPDDDFGILADTLLEAPVGSSAVFTFTTDDDVVPT